MISKLEIIFQIIENMPKKCESKGSIFRLLGPKFRSTAKQL